MSHDPHGHDDAGHGHGGHGHAAPPAGPPVDWIRLRNVVLIGVVFVVVVSMMALMSCALLGSSHEREEADRFLAGFNANFQKLSTESNDAEWQTNVHIVAGDDTEEKRNNAAKKALAEYLGSKEVMETCKHFLDHASALTPLQVRELKAALFYAADKPAAAGKLVDERIAAETAQVQKLFGFAYHLDGREVSTNEIDKALRDETDLAKRQKVWEASKEVGRGLKDGLADLQRLRNGTVRAAGFPDFFSYRVAAYDMPTEEMLDLHERLLKQLRPLYRELHTYWRYELAKRYHQPVPDQIPAHWLPNRWAQDWTPLLTVPGVDLDAALKDKSADWVVHQAERFYVSLGFEPLPQSFWEKSSLYPLPPDAPYKKNNHATAWHIDLDHDVRSLMSVENNSEWYETTHHELGHIYYYLSYSRPEVPIVLRDGASPMFHEGIGTMIGLAAMQPRFIQAVGLQAGGEKPDPIQSMHKDALFYIVFAPFASGTMTHFEYELYAKELPKDQWNKRWWEMVRKYQGVVPPTERGEEYCDAATKTHINDNPAQYYQYALANVFLMQVHEYIARKILDEDPHDTNYFGRKDVGAFLKSLLEPGATRDWRELMKEKLGSELTAEPMMRYFSPLMQWLKEQNKGRKATLADL